MPGLLYFLPEGGLKPAAFAAARHEIFGGETLAERFVNGGPGGVNGCICAHPDDPAPRYLSEAQRWAQQPGGWWLGCLTDTPPTPADLQREAMRRGHGVTLADGHQWEIPVARLWTTEDGNVVFAPTAPRAFARGEDGQIMFAEGAGLQWFMADAARFWDAGLHNFQGEYGLDAASIFAMALRALAINYRVGADEILFLQLLDEEKAIRVMQAVIDLPGFIRLMEEVNGSPPRPTAGSSSSASGGTAGSPATGRPAPTSSPNNSESES